MRKDFAVTLVAILLLAVLMSVMSVSALDFRFTSNVTELWQEPHEGANWTYANPVGDLDGDGEADMLVLTVTYDETTKTETIIAKRGYDGSHLWDDSVAGHKSAISAQPTGDLNGDKKEDMLVYKRQYDEATNITTEEVIAKRGDDGFDLWSEPVTGAESHIYAYRAGDLNGDKKEDVLVHRYINELDSTTTETVIAKRGYDGFDLWNESVNGYGGTSISATPAGDLDGDEWDDVLVDMTTSTSVVNAKVIAKRGYNGFELWNESVNGYDGTSISATPAGDLDGDEKEMVDVLVHVVITRKSGPFTIFPITNATVIAKRGCNGEHLWNKSVNCSGVTNIVGFPAGDLDGDRKEDVLLWLKTSEFDMAAGGTIATTAAVIAKRGYDGKQLWNEYVNGTSWTDDIVGTPLQVDLDGDEQVDVLVNVNEYDVATNSSTGTLIAKRGDDGTHLWKEFVKGREWPIISGNTAGDLNGDGLTDILVLTYEYDEATNTTKAKVIAKCGHNGTHLWEESANRTGSAEWFVSDPLISAVPAGELDGSGWDDVLVHKREYDEATSTTTETVIATRGHDGMQLWAAESDGPIWVAGDLWWMGHMMAVRNIGMWLAWWSGPTDLTGDGIDNVLLGPLDKVYVV
jgi:hypothetical protein